MRVDRIRNAKINKNSRLPTVEEWNQLFDFPITFGLAAPAKETASSRGALHGRPHSAVAIRNPRVLVCVPVCSVKYSQKPLGGEVFWNR